MPRFRQVAASPGSAGPDAGDPVAVPKPRRGGWREALRRPRVHEVARQLGREPQTVRADLEELGVSTASENSRIPLSAARRLRHPKPPVAGTTNRHCLPVVWGNIPVRNPDFTGRAELLADLELALSERVISLAAVTQLDSLLARMSRGRGSWRTPAPPDPLYWVSADNFMLGFGPAFITRRFLRAMRRVLRQDSLVGAHLADRLHGLILRLCSTGHPGRTPTCLSTRLFRTGTIIRGPTTGRADMWSMSGALERVPV